MIKKTYILIFLFLVLYLTGFSQEKTQSSIEYYNLLEKRVFELKEECSAKKQQLSIFNAKQKQQRVVLEKIYQDTTNWKERLETTSEEINAQYNIIKSDAGINVDTLEKYIELKIQLTKDIEEIKKSIITIQKEFVKSKAYLSFLNYDLVNFVTNDTIQKNILDYKIRYSKEELKNRELAIAFCVDFSSALYAKQVNEIPSTVTFYYNFKGKEVQDTTINVENDKANFKVPIYKEGDYLKVWYSYYFNGVTIDESKDIKEITIDIYED